MSQMSSADELYFGTGFSNKDILALLLLFRLNSQFLSFTIFLNLKLKMETFKKNLLPNVFPFSCGPNLQCNAEL